MRKVKNNGFTLIELLAVIVILGLLMGLAIPAISKYIGETRQDTYSLHEADMKAAAANKMTQCVEKNTVGCIPQSGESRTIYLNDLIDEQYSEKLRDPADTDKFCDATKSYVVVTNSNNNVVELDYQVCLVCDGYS
ncbi:MAG: type II secretion system protein, partial [Bacilli bacterium]|nr:type II secretion system protein [Bacilli bacterium]